MPFLRYRGNDRGWRVGIGLLWIPAIVIALTVEQWLKVPQGIQWISLAALGVIFVGAALVADRVLR